MNSGRWAPEYSVATLGQVEFSEIVDQVCDVGGAGGVGHGANPT
jgi:hypothetical protein